MVKLDDIDLQLLDLLQLDCKKTTKEYAYKLNLSVTAVYERIKRLERDGIIENYVALLNTKAIGKDFKALCHVRLTQHSKEFVLQFEREVQKLPEVTACFHVSGDYDYILQVQVEDMDAYREFIVSKLTVLNHIGNTHSSFVINEVKNTSAIRLFEGC